MGLALLLHGKYHTWDKDVNSILTLQCYKLEKYSGAAMMSVFEGMLFLLELILERNDNINNNDISPCYYDNIIKGLL